MANGTISRPYLYCVCTWEKSTSHAGISLLTYRSTDSLLRDYLREEKFGLLISSAKCRDAGDIVPSVLRWLKVSHQLTKQLQHFVSRDR